MFAERRRARALAGQGSPRESSVLFHTSHPRPAAIALLSACLVGLPATVLLADPVFSISTETEWMDAMATGHVQPLDPGRATDYMFQWQMFLEEGDPYPPAQFIPPMPPEGDLYVWGGGGSGGTDPVSPGLVMYWGDPTGIGGDFWSGWVYDYQVDPNLSNMLITVTVTAPQFGPLGSQINVVSFGIQDVNFLTRAWYWTCGPMGAIPWNTPTTITINTALIGLNAANPPATGYMNALGFNLQMSQFFIVDENATWVGGPQPVPPPGTTLLAMWNYWHNISVQPGGPGQHGPVSFSVNGIIDPQMDGLLPPGNPLFRPPWSPPPAPPGAGPPPFMRTGLQVPKPTGIATGRPGDVNDYYVLGPMNDMPDAEIFQSEPDLGPAGPPNGTNNQILKAVAMGLRPDGSNVNAYTFGEDFFNGDELPIGAIEVIDEWWEFRGQQGFVEPVVGGGGLPIAFYFGVDTWAIGLGGTSVQSEATLGGLLTLPVGPAGSADPFMGPPGPWLSDGEAAGDVFLATPITLPGANTLDHDDATMALLAPRNPATPPPYWSNMEDDLDALEHVGDNTLASGLLGESGNTHDRVSPTAGANGGMHPPDLGGPHNPNHDPVNTNPIIFSVDRGSGGTPGSAVQTQVLTPVEGASGDLFIAVTVPPGRPFAGMTTNLMLIDEGQLGLMPHDDLDAVILRVFIPIQDLEFRIHEALMFFDPAGGSFGPGFTMPLLNPGEAAVGFSVDNATIGLLFSAVDFECRVDGLGLVGPGWNGSGIMEQGGDIFYSDLVPPPNQGAVDMGTGLPFGTNYLWFEENAIGLDPGAWTFIPPGPSGNLGDSPDELNALDSLEDLGGQPEACCLPDDTCVLDTPSNCVNMHQGTPQGPGTACTALEPCCMTDGSCQNLDPLCCASAGGTPQGAGSACSGLTIACCLPAGGCMDVDPLCCDDLGGTPSPTGAPNCLGDLNGNGVDDACETPTGACCVGTTCTIETAASCAALGGTYLGDGTNCGTRSFVATPNLPIPDNDPNGVSHTINIPNSLQIFDVDIDVAIDHTWLGDLIITVSHGGTTVTLWSRFCGSNDDMNVIFDDNGQAVACASPTVGRITPVSAGGNALSAFNGMDAAGAWTITVSDNAAIDLGTLVRWSIHVFNPGLNPCRPREACCLPDGTCIMTDHNDCVAQGGDPQGPGTDCATAVCVPLKWAQPPLYNPNSLHPECFWGWDEPSIYGDIQIAADDFLCTDARPITDVHWWGSYVGWDGIAPPPSAPTQYHIAIWTDVPAGGIPPFSHPGTLLKEWRVDRSALNERPVACDFHPNYMQVPDGCFRYDFQIPQGEWFYQQPGPTVYWISIAAVYPTPPSCPCNGDLNGDGVVNLLDVAIVIGKIGCPVGTGDPQCDASDINCDGVVDQQDVNLIQCHVATGSPCCPGLPVVYPWGWKTRQHFYNDNALVIWDPTAPVAGSQFTSGAPIWQGWDLSFVLTSSAPPLEPKWTQPPDMTSGFDAASDYWWNENPFEIKWEQPYDPNAGFVHAHDWDDGTAYNQLIVADDWLCDGGMVTDFHWWGSIERPGAGLQAFHLSIHLDDPIACLPVEPPVRQWNVPIANISVTPTGVFNTAGDEIIRYDYNLPQPDWFDQQQGERYWFDVSAISVDPTNGNEVVWKWQESARTPLPSLCPASSFHNPVLPFWRHIVWGPPPDRFSDMAFRVTSLDPNPLVVNRVVADDFLSDGRPVRTLRWWGSLFDERYAPGASGGGIMFASSPPPPNHTDELLTVDTNTGQTTPIGVFNGTAGGVTEIEWSLDGSTLYATTGNGTSTIHTIDPTNAQALSAAVHPIGAINGLEFDASGILLGTFVTAGGGAAPSTLVQVDPNTGLLTPIGPTGFNNIGGMAFDSTFSTLYGITSGGAVPPDLLSINPGTGMATLIAPTTLQFPSGSLEFTADGRLITADGGGNLYEINKTTGAATLIGPLGGPMQLSGLSLQPGSGGGGGEPYVIDGWFISFHWADGESVSPTCPPDLLAGDPHPTVLGVYFAPADAVHILATGALDCLGHPIFEYDVDLDRCCLLCSHADPRTGHTPAELHAFLEESGRRYWLDIQAVVGVTWEPVAGAICQYADRILTGHVPSDLTADGHFWGWHSSHGPGLTHPCGPMDQACAGRIVDLTPYPPDCWDYGDWSTQPWECPTAPSPVHMAFELLTDEPDAPQACCLPDGSCMDIPALDCVCLFGGTPGGPGSDCATMAPEILAHPSDVVVCEGGAVTLTVVACPSQNVSYQWRLNGINVPGANGATLTRDPVAMGDAGTYDVVVSNAAGSATCNPCVVTVWPTGTGDTNGDGLTNGSDVPGFVAELISPSGPSQAFCASDMNADGVVDPSDLPLFVSALLGP